MRPDTHAAVKRSLFSLSSLFSLFSLSFLFSLSSLLLLFPLPVLADAQIDLITPEPRIGEPVSFLVSGSAAGLRIDTPAQTLRYLGAPPSEVTFVPQEAGEHRATLSDEAGAQVAETAFIVLPARAAPPADERLPRIKVRGRSGDYPDAQVRLSADAETADVEIDAPGLFRLRLKDVRTDGSGSVGIDRPPARSARIPGKSVLATYALDPSSASFSSGELTRIAEGRELYKCKEWAFATQTCAGVWVKLRDIVPGEEYSITIDAADPGFAETGVATVNARKPIYRPGETAELLAAVLDTSGYLVGGASIELEVTAPDGAVSSLSTARGEVAEVSQGIYSAAFDATGLEGRYDVLVHATGPATDMAMLSSFEVASSYPYDILRDAPMSIDPWRGSFESAITVSRFEAPAGPVTVTEELPVAFEVVSDGGAEVSTNGSSKFLTWRSVMPGARLSYRAEAPLVTPDLHVLGRIVVRGFSTLQAEARLWYLAIDPVSALLPILHVNTELAGVDLAAADVTAISSDDTSYVVVGKGQVLTSELSDMANISLVESVQSLNCSLTYTSQAFSPNADFSAYDSFGGNVIGTATFAASTGVDSTVTLTNLQANANFQAADLDTLVLYVRNNDAGSPQTISIDYLRCAVAYTARDITPPAVTLHSPAEMHYANNSSVTFNFTPADDRALASCSLYVDGTLNKTNATAMANNTPYLIASALSEGAHTWSINCTDTSGNSRMSEARNLTVDLTWPSAFSLSSPANATVSSLLSPTFSWAATTEANFANYTLILDDDPSFASPNYVRSTQNSATNTSYTFPTAITSNTKYYWKVIAYDRAGRSTESSQSWTYTTDTAAPSAFDLSSPASGTISISRTPLLDWSATSETNFANYTILFDDDPSFTSPDHSFAAYGAVTNSSHQVSAGSQLKPDTVFHWRVIAYDLAGQSRNSTSTFTYTTDNTGPNVTLLAPSPGWTETLSNTILFNYTVDDTLNLVASCSLIVDGSSAETDLTVAEGVPQTFTKVLSNGYYEWWVNCTDATGNENASERRFLNVSVTEDATPPLITLNAPVPGEHTSNLSVSFGYSVQDATGIENCSLYLDGVLNQTNSTPVVNNGDNAFSVAGIAEGLHDWSVSCFDNSTGHNRGDSAPRNFTADRTPPSAFTLVAPPNGLMTNQQAHTLNWTQSSDLNFKNYTVLLDDDPDFSSPEYAYTTASASATSYTTGTLADANYTWKAVAYDLAGNARDSTATWWFEVHTGKPVLANATEQPLDPVEYNPASAYNFTVTLVEDRPGTVLFEHDFFGSLQNYTPTGNSSNVYYYAIVGLNASSPLWRYRWHATDSFGNANQTAQYEYNVTRNTTSMTLTIDGVAADATVNESRIVNLTGTLDWPTTGTVTITRNGTQVAQGATPASALHNFTTPGTYVINASYPGDANYRGSSQAWNVTVLDTYAPVVSLIGPPNASNDTDGAVSYAYGVADSNAIASCTLYVNGAANGTTTGPNKGETLYFSRDYAANQNLTWQVRCVDAAGREGNSSVYSLTIAIARYTMSLLPTACNDADGCTVSNVNLSDQVYEPHGALSKSPGDNYVNATMQQTAIPGGATIKNVSIAWEKYQAAATGTFYLYWLNGSSWVTICSRTFTSSSTTTPDDVSCALPSSALPGRTRFNAGLVVRANFFYSGTSNAIQYGTDFIGVNVTYEEDTTPPSVQLNDPPDGQELGAGAILFNFTPTDASLANCTLYGDFNGTWTANQTRTTAGGLVSGSENAFSPVTLTPGYYAWNVLCYDEADNYAWAAQNYTINITPPDLTTYSQYIVLNETASRELQSVTINATVFNEGYTAATNFTVQFWNGDPDLGGVKIGSDLAILSLAGFEYTVLSVTHVLAPGPNRIFVVVDSADAVAEVSETNNEADRTFHVDAYTTYHGTLTANITLDTAQNETVYAYYLQNSSGRLFFTRTGTDIQFASLRALGRTSTGFATGDDFTDADALLNMTGFNDSVRMRWANGTDTAIATMSFKVFSADIEGVPVINLTGGFATGILWDSSKDLSSNLEYDQADKEPLVFITEVAQDTLGDYGVQDYVSEVPATLRSYAGAAQETITIYYEID